MVLRQLKKTTPDEHSRLLIAQLELLGLVRISAMPRTASELWYGGERSRCAISRLMHCSKLHRQSITSSASLKHVSAQDRLSGAEHKLSAGV
jgi:hypothetical protein